MSEPPPDRPVFGAVPVEDAEALMAASGFTHAGPLWTAEGAPHLQFAHGPPRPRNPSSARDAPRLLFGSVAVGGAADGHGGEPPAQPAQPARTAPKPVPPPLVPPARPPAQKAPSPLSPGVPRMPLGPPRAQVPIPASKRAANSVASPTGPPAAPAARPPPAPVSSANSPTSPTSAPAVTPSPASPEVPAAVPAASPTPPISSSSATSAASPSGPTPEPTAPRPQSAASSAAAAARSPEPQPQPTAVSPPPKEPKEPEEAAPEPAPPQKQPPPPKAKSWADLVRPANGAPVRQPGRSVPAGTQQGPREALAAVLRDFQPSANLKPEPIQPRGLINNGNMCYMNSVLQPLVYCPPFLRLFRRIAAAPAPPPRTLSDAVLTFSREFRGPATSPDSGLEVFGEAFAPEYVYDALHRTQKMDTKKGRQEDAEEWFGYLLHGLHDEFVAAMNASERPAQELFPEEAAGELEQWQEVGPRNRTANTRSLSLGESPVSRIFGGKWRSVIRAPGQKDSITVEPFQTLPLDISSDSIRTIEDALSNFSAPETIPGFESSTKGKVNATKQSFVDRLPPVLILHLKRFVFASGHGVRKLHKRVGFGSTLEIDPAILSPAARNPPPPKYRLFAVVYHLGQAAGGGHYTCSVLRSSGEWLHIDDQAIERTTEDEVVAAARPGYDPYLLFYAAM
ncbi:hypothetical protein DFJ74DRAFT_619482 [Hyaloraphidium curvatum]|nr:hypothetical protein DFJ74DRAFT_619482 [Hyaloraphidium curvatum]